MSIKSFFQKLFAPPTAREQIIDAVSKYSYDKNFKLKTTENIKSYLNNEEAYNQAEKFIENYIKLNYPNLAVSYPNYTKQVVDNYADSHYPNLVDKYSKTALSMVKETYSFKEGGEMKAVFLEDPYLEDRYLSVLARSDKNLLDENMPGGGLFFIDPYYDADPFRVEIVEIVQEDFSYTPLITELKLALDEY